MVKMSIDEIKVDLFTYGDYTRKEVDAMNASEAINAWLQLPKIVP